MRRHSAERYESALMISYFEWCDEFRLILREVTWEYEMNMHRNWLLFDESSPDLLCLFDVKAYESFKQEFTQRNWQSFQKYIARNNGSAGLSLRMCG